MSRRNPQRPLRVSKAARILGIPIAVAKSRAVPRLYADLQALLAEPPEWLPAAQAQRRAADAANKEREVRARQVVEGAKKAILSEVSTVPASARHGERFAFLHLDGAMVSLLGRYSEEVLDKAAWELFPEAMELMEPEFSA